MEIPLKSNFLNVSQKFFNFAEEILHFVQNSSAAECITQAAIFPEWYPRENAESIKSHWLLRLFFLRWNASVGVFHVSSPACVCVAAEKESRSWKRRKARRVKVTQHATPQISPLNIEFPWKARCWVCEWKGISAFLRSAWGTSQTVARCNSPKFFRTCIFR